VQRCHAREVDVIVVRDVDRLSRRDRDWGRLDVSGHEVRVAEWDGELMDRLYAGIKAQVAADESRKISKRVKLSEGRRVHPEDGGLAKPPRGGPRHFGYDREHEIIEPRRRQGRHPRTA
jgi:DNA invertase Pin-like site-specific DNA recombinase